jgi:hypothetical protein
VAAARDNYVGYGLWTPNIVLSHGHLSEAVTPSMVAGPTVMLRGTTHQNYTALVKASLHNTHDSYKLAGA